MSESEPGAPFVPAVIRRRDGGRWGACVGWGALGVTASLYALVLVGRAWFAPPSAFTAAVTFLPFLVSGFVAATFVLWCVLPDRGSLPVALALTLVGSALLWGPSWARRGVAPGGEAITLMSWNVRRLWGGPADGGDAAQCVIEAVTRVRPDVLSLLEVSAEDVDRIGPAIGMRCLQSNYRSSPGRSRGGLASCVADREGADLVGGGQRFVDDEDWFYVLTEVSLPTRPPASEIAAEQAASAARDLGRRVFNLLTVHLYPTAFSASRVERGLRRLARGEPDPLRDLTRETEEVVRAQSDQVAALLSRVSRLQDPTVVAGDFNSTRDAALHHALRTHLTDAWERGGLGFGATVRFLGWVPLRVDYVYASREFDVAGAEVLEVDCSDHRPVVSRLVLRP